MKGESLMRVLMMTNTYLPHVGGVARSVESFTRRLREQGHRVLVVAPEFEGRDEQEEDTIRVPAIQKFNGSDFSVRLPILNLLADQMHEFKPDIIHSHHPFLLGDTALRIAAAHDLPIVTTHHTMYEQYTHYVPVQFPVFERFVVHMATEYANLCQHVIAPSQSVADVLTQRGVTTTITVIPTGIDLSAFGQGDGGAWRAKLNMLAGAFVVGTVGRLAPEKNLGFLAEAVAAFLLRHSGARFLVVGSGPSRATLEQVFAQHGLEDRLHFTGSLQGQELIDAYHAMDVFAFASQSETQGLVLAEAMAAGRPVVAVNASGVREALRDGVNGIMLANQSVDDFAAALVHLSSMPDDERQAMRREALSTAAEYDAGLCAAALGEIYRRVVASWSRTHRSFDQWGQVTRRVETEWNLLSGRAGAILEAIREDSGARLGS
jgi:glycosyltransferase involved in cell wall biosynthesis